MALDETSATLTADPSDATPAQHDTEDGGEAVAVADDIRSDPDLAKKAAAEPQAKTPADREAAMRAAYEKVTGEKVATPAATITTKADERPRDESGKFAAKTDTKPEAKTETNPETKADAKPEAKDEAAEIAAREAEVTARRALRRAGWTPEDISLLPADKMLGIGKRMAEQQAATDQEFAKLSTRKPETKPDAEAKPETKGEAANPGGDDAATNAVQLPPEVLELLSENEQATVTTHVNRVVREQTKAAAEQLRQAHEAIVELQAVQIQRELAAEFPQLKDKPPQQYLQKFKALADTGAYDVMNPAGLRQLMEDAAFIAFGRETKADLQRSMIERNKAALNGQPDPRTLTASTGGKKTVNAETMSKLVFDEMQRGGTEQEIRQRVAKLRTEYVVRQQ